MDTQQRPCRLRGSISRVKWRWCPPLMSKWLYRLSLLPLLLSLSHSSGSNSGTRWLTTCRLQTLLTRAQSVIRQNWSAGMLSALPSTSRKPRLFLVQSCGLSQVKSLAPMCNGTVTNLSSKTNIKNTLVPKARHPLMITGWRCGPVTEYTHINETWLSIAYMSFWCTFLSFLQSVPHWSNSHQTCLISSIASVYTTKITGSDFFWIWHDVK